MRVINSYAANTTVYAYYVSTPDTAPGKILIEERGVGGSAFVAVANNSTCGNCFVPPIPTSGKHVYKHCRAAPEPGAGVVTAAGRACADLSRHHHRRRK